MHVAILQRWEGDDTFSLLFQAPKDKEDECKHTLKSLREEAYKKKLPVEYKMVPLDGEVDTPDNPSIPHRKIIVPHGKLKGMEIYLERDVREE